MEFGFNAMRVDLCSPYRRTSGGLGVLTPLYGVGIQAPLSEAIKYKKCVHEIETFPTFKKQKTKAHRLTAPKTEPSTVHCVW